MLPSGGKGTGRLAHPSGALLTIRNLRQGACNEERMPWGWRSYSWNCQTGGPQLRPARSKACTSGLFPRPSHPQQI